MANFTFCDNVLIKLQKTLFMCTIAPKYVHNKFENGAILRCQSPTQKSPTSSSKYKTTPRWRPPQCYFAALKSFNMGLNTKVNSNVARNFLKEWFKDGSAPKCSAFLPISLILYSGLLFRRHGKFEAHKVRLSQNTYISI